MHFVFGRRFVMKDVSHISPLSPLRNGETVLGELPQELRPDYQKLFQADSENFKCVKDDLWNKIQSFFSLPEGVGVGVRQGWKVVIYPPR
jgi:hypothetical protein